MNDVNTRLVVTSQLAALLYYPLVSLARAFACLTLEVRDGKFKC
jgi:hypothetical protein